jgi:phosphoribosylformylglycinamidine synthase
LFFVRGDLTDAEVERLAGRLLTDPVTEVYTLGEEPSPAGVQRVERTLLPGVTDPAAETLTHAAALIGISLEQAATGERYDLTGDLTAQAVQRIAAGVLSNAVIHRISVGEAISAPFVPAAPTDLTVETIPVRGLDDAALLALSAERRLSLDLAEMRAIRAYFEAEGRDATDAELEMLAQTWSEHCVHKTFRAKVTYTGPAHGAPADSEAVTQDIDGLLKTYLRSVTDKLAKPWVRSAFVDNAGVIAFDDQYDLAFKVETHNRPSALEPFGGANTGAGGVIRDVLGVSARPIANTDILCFGFPDTPADSLPENVLHPRRIIDGVVHGIEDYGNKMGIPTVNGAVHYHAGYTANPLVFAGCVGLAPVGSHRSTAEDGDLIVVMGGRTGRDGLRGATFSSMEMDTTTAQVSGGAVQIGHPINEKQVMEAVLRARDAGLYTAITDCGAGGLSSAIGEMGKDLGARVQLADVPLKYPGLRPWEIWLSEAQERMVLAVPSQHWDALKAICDAHDVEVVSVGTYCASGQLELTYGDQSVGSISMDFLHHGIPRRELKAEWTPLTPNPSPSQAGRGASEAPELLLQMLAHPTVRSKSDVIHRYDHEVGTGTAIKPLVGEGAGPGDAAVIVPQDTLKAGGTKAFSLSVGMCPQYTAHDPYAMAWAAIDESIRNAVAVGADPDQLAILDNFSWGNTNLPDRMGELVRCLQGCYDAALAYGTPYISGKDSLNNEYLDENGVRRAIPGTLVISTIGIVPDVANVVTSDLKSEGNTLYLIGQTRPDELAGSLYADLTGAAGGVVPQPVPGALNTYRAVYQAIRGHLIVSAHDVSEGGLAVSLAEMCIGGRIGATVPGVDGAGELFSESQGRLVVEVEPDAAAEFEALMAEHGAPFARLGTVGGESLFLGGETISVEALAGAWGAPLTPRPPLPRKRGEGGKSSTPMVSAVAAVHTEDSDDTDGDGKLGRVERFPVTPAVQRAMVEIAKKLRRKQTPSEAILWKYLRSRRLNGQKFRRQQDVGVFVLDFYCPDQNLAVEVDGPIHETQQEADEQRQAILEQLGIRFVRVTADEVVHDIDAVLGKIRAAFVGQDTPTKEISQTLGEDEANSQKPDSDTAQSSLPQEIGQNLAQLPLSPLARERGQGGEGRPRVLIMHAPGTNRDRDAVLACELAGGAPEIVTVNQLIRGERSLLDYHMLVIPGGFSYGDDLGAGALWALTLRERIAGIDRFVQDGRPVLGICNGFQTLVKSGLLPGDSWDGGPRKITLTYNAQGRFECRWVLLEANPFSPCLFTAEMDDPIYCPVAHGEGRVQVADEETRLRIHGDGLAALRYITEDDLPAYEFPANPNGSVDAIAGLCNPAGNVFGLMPHPENHIFPWQHPQHTAGRRGLDGLRLFQNGIKNA